MKILLDRILSLKNRFSAHQKFSNGSEIRFVNRMTLRYSQGGRSVDVGFHIYEGLIGKKASVSFWEVDCWNVPYNAMSISDDDKKCIVEKIVEYCASRKIECIFEYEKSQTYQTRRT